MEEELVELDVPADVDVLDEVATEEPLADETLEVEPVLEEELLLVVREESMYSSSRFPAPQYSKLFPGQRKLQSPAGAGMDPAPRELPQ